LADYSLPSFTGAAALNLAQHLSPEIPFIFVSGTLGEELAVDMLKRGASDYVLKHRLHMLVPAVKRALREAKERRARKKMEEERNLLMTAIEQTAEHIMIIDKDGSILYVNPSVEQTTGYLRTSIIGKNIKILKNDETSETFYQELWETIKNSKVWQGHLINKKQDGTLYESAATISPVKNADGEVSHFVAIQRDVTQEMKLENQLRRAQKMEALGMLAGGVAHDLNNILCGIVSYPELLLLNLPEDSPLRKPLYTIQNSGYRAVAVVQDLLTIAKGVASVKSVININEIVQKHLTSPEFFTLQEKHPMVAIKTNLSDDILNIKGSEIHIRKSIMNLLINAFEAIPMEGMVKITTFNQYVDKPIKGYDQVCKGEFVVLVISDTGHGISKTDLERIFEPFYSKKIMGRSGSGLGLTIVWNTVKDHDGYINIVTDTQDGTAFELYFKVCRENIQQGGIQNVPIEHYKGNGETILIIDDEDSQREIANTMLSCLGYKPISCSSGEEAVELLKKQRADLILLDMIMEPGMNGRQTYEQIITLHPKQKAIIASGFSETEEVKLCQSLGAGKFIRKPYTLETIGIAIKEELKNEQN
ncbi:MAG: response regulator, partial [Desulfobacterales bacterium]|nr:response regulator [Desulfobacterales bacterium]